MNISDILTTTLPPTNLLARVSLNITTTSFTVLSSNLLLTTNYRLYNNPYESLYSTAYEDEIKKTNQFKGITCVIEIVTYIYNNSKAFFAGTPHKSI